MHNARLVSAAVIGAMLVSGCSTRPRNFAASVSTPVIDRTAFESDYRTCQSLVRSGRMSDFKAGAAQALASGAGAIGTGAAMASTGMVGIGTSGGAAAAATMALPVVGFLAGFGVSRMIRGGKESKLKRGMAACLGEYGYAVADWQKLPERADAARFSSDHSADTGSIPASAEPFVPEATGKSLDIQPSRPLKSS